MAIGFGVTYEGLKRPRLFRFAEMSLRFGVTYEGLKPGQNLADPERVGEFWSYL